MTTIDRLWSLMLVPVALTQYKMPPVYIWPRNTCGPRVTVHYRPVLLSTYVHANVAYAEAMNCCVLKCPLIRTSSLSHSCRLAPLKMYGEQQWNMGPYYTPCITLLLYHYPMLLSDHMTHTCMWIRTLRPVPFSFSFSRLHAELQNGRPRTHILFAAISVYYKGKTRETGKPTE